MKHNFAPLLICAFALILFACAPESGQTFSATLPLTITAPVYTETPLPLSPTPPASVILAPTTTPPPQPSETLAPTTALVPTLSGTQPLYTLTPAFGANNPPADEHGEAPLSAAAGWSCDDFPCEDDIPAFLQRIQVPPGYHVEYVGQFPGQPMQITYGRDGRLYATVLENGTRNGAVYVMDADGTTTRYSGDFVSPVGLAFQPGTDVLYVSARETLEKGGGVWRVPPGGGTPEEVISGLPCCFRVIDNQPNGMTFGQDGYLYLGVGSLSDNTVNPPHSARNWADLVPNEASILRIQPHTGEVTVYAAGIRDPFDLAADSAGQFYATDNGLIAGLGDRVLKVDAGANYGWPYWRTLGCDDCPVKPAVVTVSPDLIDLPPYSRPRGIAVYTGTQYPADLFDNVFVALWNGIEGGQRIIRIDPKRVGEEGYTPEAFVTGLIRPIDVAVAPDGSLVVADYVYGHVWRIVYER